MPWISFKNNTKPLQKSRCVFEKICCGAALALSMVFFGIVGFASIFQTSVLDPENFAGEVILYKSDNAIANIILVVCVLALAFWLYQCRSVFPRINEKKLTKWLFAYTIVIGTVWVIRVQCIPAADSGSVFSAAQSMIRGDFSPLTVPDDALNGVNYFKFYPYQLGIVFIDEIIGRIFGYETALPLQIANVLALALLYVALMKMAGLVFRARGVSVILAVFLAACLQPVFFTAFAYGNIIGFSLGAWACYCVIRFMQSEGPKRSLWFIPASALMALSIIAKYNDVIWMIAIALGLIIYVVRTKDWKYLVHTTCFCVISLLGINLVIYSYEARGGMRIADQASRQTLQLQIGLNESYMAPGWFNYGLRFDYAGRMADGSADTAAKANIESRVRELSKHPGYAVSFFGKKILSEWNEPSYESIWVSQVKAHYYGQVEESSWLHKVYNGSWGSFLYSYFDIYQMIVFLLFFVAMIALIANRCGAEGLMLACVPLGGFLYHLIFEAKSQYCLTYFILIVFFAAYGLYFLLKSISICVPSHGKKNGEKE